MGWEEGEMMELWIRSQDKMALSNFDLLILEKVEKGYMFIADHYKNMGVYSTKERALEILDEIQQLDTHNNPNITINKDVYSPIRIVYTMPRE